MRAATRIVWIFGLMLASGLSYADYQLNMSPGVTSFSQGAYEIHQMVMWICVVIGIVVFGAMIFSIINHRKSKGAVPATFHENTTIEIVWTIIPFLILIAMAITIISVKMSGFSATYRHRMHPTWPPIQASRKTTPTCWMWITVWSYRPTRKSGYCLRPMT